MMCIFCLSTSADGIAIIGDYHGYVKDGPACRRCCHLIRSCYINRDALETSHSLYTVDDYMFLIDGEVYKPDVQW